MSFCVFDRITDPLQISLRFILVMTHLAVKKMFSFFARNITLEADFIQYFFHAFYLSKWITYQLSEGKVRRKLCKIMLKIFFRTFNALL